MVRFLLQLLIWITRSLDEWWVHLRTIKVISGRFPSVNQWQLSLWVVSCVDDRTMFRPRSTTDFTATGACHVHRCAKFQHTSGKILSSYPYTILLTINSWKSYLYEKWSYTRYSADHWKPMLTNCYLLCVCVYGNTECWNSIRRLYSGRTT